MWKTWTFKAFVSIFAAAMRSFVVSLLQLRQPLFQRFALIGRLPGHLVGLLFLLPRRLFVFRLGFHDGLVLGRLLLGGSLALPSSCPQVEKAGRLDGSAHQRGNAGAPLVLPPCPLHCF